MARSAGSTSNGSASSDGQNPTPSSSTASESFTNDTSGALKPAQATGSSKDSFSYHAVELAPTDALPYFDRDLELQPGLRARVDALIADEQNLLPPMDLSRLPPAYEPFSSRPDLREELERVASGQPSPYPLDTRRYTLPSPSAGSDAPLDEWQAAVDTAHAQLAHMDLRLKNVELLKKYGSNAWRLSNFQQEQDIRMLSEQLEAVKAETNEINRLRQKDQTEVGSKLALLEKRWTELISRGLQLEVANVTTRVEVEQLHSKKRKLEAQLTQME